MLVAGLGNILRRDDGFGVEVVRRLEAGRLEAGRLEAARLPAEVRVEEFGISGLALVQELMSGYDVLVIVDAWDRGAPPGEVFVVEPSVPDARRLPPEQFRDYLADSHYTDPSKALFLAREIGVLPPTVRLVACQPEDAEDYAVGLSGEVLKGVDRAAGIVRRLVDECLNAPSR